MKADKIKAIIIDDEENSRDLMEKLLHSFPDIELLGSADSADEGVMLVMDQMPDLIFLDISMPGKDGFDFISELKKLDHKIDIIFVTAYDQFAIQAFKVSAFDYLLKPVDEESLEETLMRYRSRRNKVSLEDKLNTLIANIEGGMPRKKKKISIPTRTGLMLFSPDDILYLEAEGNYTNLKTVSGESYYIPYNLGRIEELIDCNEFKRIGRSYLINFNYLSGFDRKQKSLTLMYSDKPVVLQVPLKAIKHLEDELK